MEMKTEYRRPRPGAVLLSLDGGGVKGVSSLLILQRIMNKVREIEGRDLDRERSPHEYFDLAGGTSTGGLAALMLFRLNMPTSTVIGHYRTLSSTVFAPMIAGHNFHDYPFGYALGNGWLLFNRVRKGSAFSASRLEEAIDEVTKDLPRKGETKLCDGSGGRMLMCATAVDVGETVLFRSYSPPSDSSPQSQNAKDIDHSKITIKEACRATSAAPTFLPPMKIPARGSGKLIKFWDGGLLNNNPIDQVWDARYDLPQARVTDKQGNVRYVEPRVSCVVSLGTSYCAPPPPEPEQNLVHVFLTTIGFATNTWAKHWDFMGNNIRRNARLPSGDQTKYFRYNAKASKDINLDDYKQMPLLEADTVTYLDNMEKKLNADGDAMSAQELENHIDRCARELAKTKFVSVVGP